MTKEEYKNHLNHPEWIKKRGHILAKYGNKCSEQGCNRTKNLEVHHKTYTDGKLPWEYPDENFIVLCEEHHKNYHGIPYTRKICKGRDCTREIPDKFDYCIECHNKLIAEAELEKKRLEDRIINLESILDNNNNPSQHEIEQLKAEKNQLLKGKSDLEIKLSEMKKLNSKFKDEIKSDVEKIKTKISSLEKEKNNKDNLSQDRQRNLELEIENLRQKMRELENVLKESKKIEEINKSVKESHKKLESKINVLIFSLVSAIIISITAYKFWQPQPTITYTQPPPGANETINKKLDVPSPKELPKSDPQNDSIPESKKTEENKLPSSSPIKQSSYKIITIEEINDNIETKVQISEIVRQVKELENGNAYLNIGGVYPYNKLSLVIFKNDRVKFEFGDLRNYENKLVKIKGEIRYYKGRPQIIINHKWQLQEIQRGSINGGKT